MVRRAGGAPRFPCHSLIGGLYPHVRICERPNMRMADKTDRELVPSVNGANVSLGGNVPTGPDGRGSEYAVGQLGWRRFDTICSSCSRRDPTR